MKWTIVYFDDEVQNIECYKLMLQDKFILVGCENALNYENVLRDNFAHALLIDVHMPMVDGYKLYQDILKNPLYNGCPVFFISGDQSDQNKIKSFEQGGVDFLPRGINEEEMILRLSNKIKHFLKMSSVIELGNLKLDAQAFKVYLNQNVIELTLIEMRILSILLRTYPVAVSKKQMLKDIWGDESEIKGGTINTHLTNLRNKIEGWSNSIKVKEENIYIQQN